MTFSHHVYFGLNYITQLMFNVDAYKIKVFFFNNQNHGIEFFKSIQYNKNMYLVQNHSIYYTVSNS